MKGHRIICVAWWLGAGKHQGPIYDQGDERAMIAMIWDEGVRVERDEEKQEMQRATTCRAVATRRLRSFRLLVNLQGCC